MFCFSEVSPCCKSNFSFRLTEFLDVFKLQHNLYGHLCYKGRDVQAFRDKGNVELYRKCTTNYPDHSKTAFILGVLSTKAYPECLLPVENSKPMFLSQMVRKAAAASCNPDLREQRFPQKAVAPLKAAQDFGSASAPQPCSCFFFELLLVWCYCCCFWKGFI